MGEASMFRRDEVLGGLPARRVSSVLYAIERRTATLAAQARTAMASYQTERSARERETAFLSALSSGRTSRHRPSVQDLERYAPAWAELVPEDPGSRAALAHLMAQTYRLPRAWTPNITTALGLADPPVVQAFAQQQGTDIDSLWAPRLSLPDRLRWRRSRVSARVESLPPFWMAFALTLTEAIGLGVLVVPVALAGIGPLPGLFLLIVLGIANLVTVGALVEAITRHGPMRYGSAYFGRLVSDLLGRSASVGIGVGLLALNLVTLLAYYLAFGATLSSSTGIWTGAWIVLLCAIDLAFLYRETIDATVASAILIGLVNLGLMMLLVLLAVPHISIENAAYTDLPFLGTGVLDSGTLGLVFGVVLMAYFGHTSAANASKSVLRIDPGGRGLLWGNLAALAVVIALYCVTVFAFLGALGPEPLLGYGGTVLTPLAALVGPAVDVVGSVFVTLAIGLASIYYSLGLYNQVNEVLPRLTGDAPGRGGSWRSSRWARRLLAMLPTILVFGFAEVLILADAASIADALALAGTLAVPLIGGILPMLLIAAARRRGELVPERVVRFLGRNSAVVILSALFITAVLAHGLFIWQEPLARLLAIGVGVGLVLLVVRLLATRTFEPRTVVEVRRWGRHGLEQLESVVSRGRSVFVGTPHKRDDGIGVELPAGVAPELVVWAHQVTAEGESEPLGGTVRLGGADGGIVTVAIERGRGTLRLEGASRARHLDIRVDQPGETRTEER